MSLRTARVSALLAATLLSSGSLALPAAAQQAGGCLQVQVDNPHPGDPFTQGKIEVSGRASDSAAQSGSGVDRVQIFVDSRDLGGQQVGEADATLPAGAPPDVTASSITGARFSVLADLSSADLGNHTLFVYARSAVSGAEVVAGVPINVGATPLGTAGTLSSGQPPVTTASPECQQPAAPVSTSNQNSSSTTANTSTTPDETISVVLDAPHPGAVLTPGRYEVSGRASSNTSSIDRVQVFLDNRDLGGVSLGDATISGNRFHAIVNFPTNQFGLHSVFVYARSSGSQKEGIATTGVNITSSH
jgi:hypothetical protein